MAYIVVYQREDGSSGVEECADIDLAIVTAERLRNVESIERPRILKTEEITYDFKPYYRVEVMAEGASETATSESAEVSPPPPPPSPEPESDAADDSSDVDEITDVEVVEDGDDDETLEDASEEIEDEEPVEEAADEPEDAEDEEVESPGDTPTVTTSGGLFGDRSTISDRFPSSSSDNDPPSSSTRRGLFGR